MLEDSNIDQSKMPEERYNNKTLREFYKEYCGAIKSQESKDHINIHDVLMSLSFIGPDNGEEYKTDGAVSSEVVRAQHHKFTVEFAGRYEKDDFVKNLFKMLCGVMDMNLKQRGTNPMPEIFLRQYLDGINFNVGDNDLILLN